MVNVDIHVHDANLNCDKCDIIFISWLQVNKSLFTNLVPQYIHVSLDSKHQSLRLEL